MANSETDHAFGTNRHPLKFKAWLKRLGWAGFLFFLIKGLLWLIIPALIAWGVFGD